MILTTAISSWRDNSRKNATMVTVVGHLGSACLRSVLHVKHKPPIYHRLFAFIGFGVSVVFINAIANEVINILQTFGIIFKLTDSILGLTILAWGNSLGGNVCVCSWVISSIICINLICADLIADLSMARHGYPGMAIAACFGGPMLSKSRDSSNDHVNPLTTLTYFS